MKRLTKYLISIIVIAVLFSLTSNIIAQDAQNAQSFYGSPLKANPAVMGMNTDLKVIANYRSQWGSIRDGYTTPSLTVLYPIYMNSGNSKLDLGLSAGSDKAGAFSTTDVSLAVGYNIQIANSGYISLSLMGGFIQKTLDASILEFGDQYQGGSFNSNNSTGTVPSESISYPSVGFGLMWYHNPSRDDARLNAYAGVSGYHLNQPNESLLGGTGMLPRRLSYQAGVKVLGENKIDFTPNFIVSTQNGSQDIAAGLYIDYLLSESAKFVVGAWYKQNNSLAAMLALEHQSFFLGYSYDVPTSQISSAVDGVNTHEITLAYKMNMAKKKGVDANKSLF